MKRVIPIILSCVVSFSAFSSTLESRAKSGNAAAAYQLAELYEDKDDLKNALFWYKEAARLAMLNQNNEQAFEQQTVHINNTPPEQPKETTEVVVKEAIKDEELEQRIVKNSRIYSRYDEDNVVFHFMDSAFGLQPYHSNYILPVTYDNKSHGDGRKHVETTFQISFKKDIFENTFGFNEAIGFAYTQRNWWQITESSSPFRETNYLPEMYVRIPNRAQNSVLKGTQFGFLHESNGQGNDAGKSRSWNRLYLEGYFQYNGIYIVPRAWYKIYENRKHDDNHDIQDYLGYGDLNVFIPYEKHLVKVMIRNNLKLHDNHGAIQADWTYPLGDTGLYGYIQYFYGYGESLIDYNKKNNRIGIGIALSR